MKKAYKRDAFTEKKQIKRLFLWAVITAVVCAAIGVSVFLYFFVPRDSDTHILAIPDFVGILEGEVEARGEIDVKREWVYCDDAPRGVVISQTPYAGARRKVKNGERREVTLYISLGERTERIPELCGVDQLSAAAALRSIGARVRSVAVYGDGDDGVVIGTSPDADAEIREGQIVTLFVSRRKVESPVTVPEFIGMEQSEAVRLALSMGLFIENIDFSGGEPRVFEQSIPKGARVVQGSYISFKVGTEYADERSWPPTSNKEKEDD